MTWARRPSNSNSDRRLLVQYGITRFNVTETRPVRMAPRKGIRKVKKVRPTNICGSGLRTELRMHRQRLHSRPQRYRSTK
jgi:hypothetical protein